MEAGSSRMSHGSLGKLDRTCRSWSNEEERILIASLKEHVVLGWKGENDFRGGYLNKLEESIRKFFPSIYLKAQPHINSRVTTWKKYYGSLLLMLSCIGCSFNDKTKLIECEDDLWNIIVNVDPNARTMRNKEWKLFDDWKEIFGKDHATGETAEDVMDAVNEMIQEDNMLQASFEPRQGTNMEDDVEADQDTNSCSHSENVAESSRGGKRKRKYMDNVSVIYDLLGQLCRNTDEHLEKIAQRIGYEYDIGQAKKKVFDMLSNISDLTIHQKFDVCEILAEKTDRLEIFLGLPHEARSQYVRRLLGLGIY